ncbi:bifunctional phosphoribosyl-AMP cyclohydrolase/phosphoribosyl-ATP diphosphatase HisIE [Gynurincola endophyticus]|jgi:phosphoribosyl-ATP pyrophosphohydrolase/phosphoribosyl-AMP cyclohydrolase|uniref:bifunctional phosphoribosyl-AMP cyclohydrolase/phosphoribosyl-ATP diphosphatase HisIE n=1 Tax=Gynurincola endophyticus TaxID=2479004 RepID=UPI000F8F717F|nr:bifunctional phosphoribosyl-AMP cyclohydrolase/phosphoribosyl-ATP diphosphatase HisIE [Gynurincola endophyticus]
MTINFSKYTDGLVPAIIQDVDTCKVLMLGFMNEAAFRKTNEEGKVTFFSRTKNRLWTKGEESGNFLLVKKILLDCDADSLLIQVQPVGPTCHTGADTCWNEKNLQGGFLTYLENIIEQRRSGDEEKSYVKKLFSKGINKIAQKVGEEAVEVVIEAKDDNDELFLNESADLLFHYLILLNAKGYRLNDVVNILKERHAQ